MEGGQGPGQQGDVVDVVFGARVQGQAHEVGDLHGGQQDRDAGGESQGDGVGDELDQAAHVHEAQQDQKQAGHDGGDDQAAHAVLHGEGGQDDDEGCRGAGDLHAGAAQKGCDDAGHDRGVQTVLRGDAGRDGQGHGQGNGDDGDDDSGGDVGA